jgi:hypothetical protein
MYRGPAWTATGSKPLDDTDGARGRVDEEAVGAFAKDLIFSAIADAPCSFNLSDYGRRFSGCTREKISRPCAPHSHRVHGLRRG